MGEAAVTITKSRGSRTITEPMDYARERASIMSMLLAPAPWGEPPYFTLEREPVPQIRYPSSLPINHSWHPIRNPDQVPVPRGLPEGTSEGRRLGWAREWSKNRGPTGMRRVQNAVIQWELLGDYEPTIR